MRTNVPAVTAVTAVTVGIAVLAAAAGGGGAFANGSASGGSRLDDGKQLVSLAKISEQQAITTAQGAASGGLNEVDLEHYDGHLVWNVDVGSKNVKVDARTGQVLDAAHAD
jgi:uncharacterized membrane protein YkoI